MKVPITLRVMWCDPRPLCRPRLMKVAITLRRDEQATPIALPAIPRLPMILPAMILSNLT